MTRKRIPLAAGAAVALLGLGALVGVFVAAPPLTDWRNTCVAGEVVSRAGVGGPPLTLAPGDDPRARWTPPPTWTVSHAPLATPRPVP